MKSFIDEDLRFLTSPKSACIFFSRISHARYLHYWRVYLCVCCPSFVSLLVDSFSLRKHHNIISSIPLFHVDFNIIEKFVQHCFYRHSCPLEYTIFFNFMMFLLGTCFKMSVISLTSHRKILPFCRRIKQFIVDAVYGIRNKLIIVSSLLEDVSLYSE